MPPRRRSKRLYQYGPETPEGRRDRENARRLREAGGYCARHDGPARRLVVRESGEVLCLACLPT